MPSRTSLLSAVLASAVLLAVGIGASQCPQPVTQGRVALPGLSARVRVSTDALGVPHVEAGNDHDVFLAQGFLHARDRFFQMDANRRAAYGTLAELTGSYVDLFADARVRLLGLRAAAQRSLDLLTPQERALMQAYADGVNAWLGSNPLPPEYAELEVSTVPPWQVLDMLVMAKAVAARLHARIYEIDDTDIVEGYAAALGDAAGAALYYEDLNRFAPMVPNATVPDALGAAALAKAKALLPPPGGGAPVAVRRARERLRANPVLARALERPHFALGSNVWGVAGSASATGSPLLASDGHAELTAPSRDYEMHLVVNTDLITGGLDVSGSSTPGIPGAGGRSPYLVLGATAFSPDLSDVFRDRLIRDDPACPARLCIHSAGALHPVEERVESYRLNQLGDGTLDNPKDVTPLVLAGAPEVVNVLSVPFRSFGPILQIADRSVVEGGPATETSVLTLQYTGLHGTREAGFLFGSLRARNVFEFRDALRDFTVPAGNGNLVVADREGNLAYFAAGEIPLRADLEAGVVAGAPPWLIRDGSGPANWIPDPAHSQGQVLPFAVIPFDEMPHVVNPPAGFVVNCNEDPSGSVLDNDLLNAFRPSSPTAIHYLGDQGTLGLRNGRVTALLRAKLDAGDKLSVDDMKRIQGNVQALDAELTTPFLVAAFDAAKRPGAPAELATFAGDAGIEEAIERFRVWDFSSPTGIPEGYDASDDDGELDPEVSPDEAAHSVANMIFVVWRWKLIVNQIEAPLRALGLNPSWSLGSWNALHHLLSQDPFTGVGASGVDFFAEPAGLVAEDRRDVALLRALRDALDTLASPAYATAFGGSTLQADWRWGKVHRLTLAHRLGGAYSIPPAGGFADLAPGLPGIPRDGGFDTVNNGAHSDGDSPGAMRLSHGAVSRWVWSLARRSDFGFAALSGGASGDPASSTYASQLATWLTVDYHEVPMNARDVRAAATRVELFEPPAP